MYRIPQYAPNAQDFIDIITIRRVINGRAVRVDAITEQCFVLFVDGLRVGNFVSHTAIHNWLSAQEIS